MSGTIERPLRASETGSRQPSRRGIPGRGRVLPTRSPESAFFSASAPIAVARAPGRLDVLGGIADYSGSLVLELPLAAAALAAAQLGGDGSVVAVSGDRRMALDVARPARRRRSSELAGRFAGTAAWAAYVLGPIALLLREERALFAGLRVLVSSDVPEGKGLASSAAIGVAVLQAVAACLGRAPEPRRLALLSQRAEQLFAGAPCGVDGPDDRRVRRARAPPAPALPPGRDRALDPAPGATRGLGDRLRASATPSPAPPTGGRAAPPSWARRCSAASTST